MKKIYLLWLNSSVVFLSTASQFRIIFAITIVLVWGFIGLQTSSTIIVIQTAHRYSMEEYSK